MRWFVFLLLSLCGLAQAHSLDQLIQAAYLTLDLDSLKLELVMTPGQEVAPDLLGFIDQNQDGQLSQLEMEGYAERVANELNLIVDSQPQNLRLQGVTTPQTADFLAGTGIFQIVAQASLPERPGGHVLEFRNVYQPVPSAYLVNGFVQSEQLQLNGATRSPDQREYRLEYRLEGKHNVGVVMGLAGAVGVLVFGTVLGRRFLLRGRRTPAFTIRLNAEKKQ